MTTIIALTSRAMGAGKSTVAKHLCERHGFTKIAFAEPIKNVSFALFAALGVNAVDAARYVWGDWKEREVPGLQYSHVLPFSTNITTWLIEQVGGDDPLGFLGLSFNELNHRFAEFLIDYVPYTTPLTSRRWQQLFGTEFGRQMIRESIWTDIAMERAYRHERVVIDDMRFPNELTAVRVAGGFAVRVERPGIEVTSSHASEGQLDALVMPTIWNTGDIAYLRQGVDAFVGDLLVA